MVELAVAERNAGRFRVALEQHDAARALCQISLNPNGTACVYNHFHRATLLPAALVVQARHHLREGRPRQAMALSTQAQSLIADRGVAENPFVVPAQALHGISLHMMGAQPAALQQLDRVHAQLVQALGAEHPRTQLASIIRARPLWALQRQQEAVALIDHALPVLREAMGEQAPTFVRILTLRAELVAAAPGSAPDMQRIDFFI